MSKLLAKKFAAFYFFYRPMKNKKILISTVSIIFLFILSCGITDSITTLNEEKIGIPECDEVFEMLTEQMKPKEDESHITKATRQTILNSIRDSFKSSIKNENDKEKLTQTCKKYLKQLRKYKAEEEAKR